MTKEALIAYVQQHVPDGTQILVEDGLAGIIRDFDIALRKVTKANLQGYRFISSRGKDSFHVISPKRPEPLE